MKCRFLYDNAVTDPKHPLFGPVSKGTVYEHPECFWLCAMHRSFMRPLNTQKGKETFELVTMDGSGGHPAQLVAEPADQECLDELIRRGWIKPDYVLKPDVASGQLAVDGSPDASAMQG